MLRPSMACMLLLMAGCQQRSSDVVTVGPDKSATGVPLLQSQAPAYKNPYAFTLEPETGRSSTCRIRVHTAFAAGVAPSTDTIMMTNESKPCGYLHRTTMGSLVYGAPIRVIRKPAHGEVSIQVTGPGTIVTYRPEAEFHGVDRFALLQEDYNIERSFDVTVR